MYRVDLTIKKLIACIVVAIVILGIAIAVTRRSQQDDMEVPNLGFTIEVAETPEPEELLPADVLAVHFINVGDGDSILLVQGDYAMLVDGGNSDMGTRVFQYLRGEGVQSINYLVATHPFADHIGGLPDVLRRIPVRNALIPMIYHDTPTYEAFLVALENSGANVTVPFAGDVFNLGNAEVTVLSPHSTDVFENIANYSIVLRVVFGDTAFLLMGDAMRDVEAILLDGTSALSADVLKVGRHGDTSATTSGFLDAVNPAIAVVSVAEGSSWVSREILNRLSNRHIHTFLTGRNGNVVITSDGVRLSVTVERDGR